MLGSLYALGRKDKAAADATIESMRTVLKDKEAAIVSLEKNFEAKLLNEQEERTSAVKKVKEEQQSLMNQLNSANSTIAGLGKELKGEKRLIEEMNVQKDSLQTRLSKNEEDKRSLEETLKEKLDSIKLLEERINLLSLELKEKEDHLQGLRSSLTAKESELEDVTSISSKTKDDLAKAQLEIKALKDTLLENQKELDLKNSAIGELNARINSIVVEKDNLGRKLDLVQEEYNDLKSSYEQKSALDAKLLEERQNEIHRLNEQLELSNGKVAEKQKMISSLTNERNDLEKKLDVEVSTVENLKHELGTAQDLLDESRKEASNLSKELQS